VALAGPWLVTLTKYVTFVPKPTGSGASVSVIAKSAEFSASKRRAAENSEVFPFVSVAVAVRNSPAARGGVNTAVKLALPSASVVTLVKPA
jgi:hypothetical protein